MLNAIAVANVGELLGNGASYAVRSIQNSFQILTSEHIQLISKMMEQQKQFAFNANVPLDKDVRVTGMVYSLLSQCEFGWGHTSLQTKHFAIISVQQSYYLESQNKTLRSLGVCIQDNSRSCQSNVPRPRISGISILGLCYETLRHQNLSFTQQEDLNMFLYISIPKLCSIHFYVCH